MSKEKQAVIKRQKNNRLLPRALYFLCKRGVQAFQEISKSCHLRANIISHMSVPLGKGPLRVPWYLFSTELVWCLVGKWSLGKKTVFPALFAADLGHMITFWAVSSKSKGCVQLLQSIFWKAEACLPFLFPAGWNVDETLGMEGGMNLVQWISYQMRSCLTPDCCYGKEEKNVSGLNHWYFGFWSLTTQRTP